MTDEDFTYEDFEATRAELIIIVNKILNDTDKDFLLSFHRLSPSWENYSFQDFPAIKWKLQNLRYLKKMNPEKFNMQLNILEDILSKE